jgi:xanthine/uracil permease
VNIPTNLKPYFLFVIVSIVVLLITVITQMPDKKHQQWFDVPAMLACMVIGALLAVFAGFAYFS